MRTLGLVLLVTAASASAEPRDDQDAKSSKALALPDIVKEAQINVVAPRLKQSGGGNDHPAMTGGIVRGIVVDPGPHPDAKPYPNGMLIRPPDPHDPMALEIRSNQQIAGERQTTWLPRDISRRVLRGADKVWETLTPH